MKEGSSDKSFEVRDHRRFDSEGKLKEEAEKIEEERKKGSAAQEEKKEAKGTEEKGEEAKKEAATQLPPINFSTFILSLASTAQIQLGMIPNPETQKTEVQLPLAKQTIDILTVLEDKTKGNLEEHEKRLLEELLFQLRMQYVEKKEK